MYKTDFFWWMKFSIFQNAFLINKKEKIWKFITQFELSYEPILDFILLAAWPPNSCILFVDLGTIEKSKFYDKLQVLRFFWSWYILVDISSKRIFDKVFFFKLHGVPQKWGFVFLAHLYQVKFTFDGSLFFITFGFEAI